MLSSSKHDVSKARGMAKTYDVIIIGGGPGGYNCAIRAAQLGLSVACVEKRGTLGGTCLNVGCIPSKALLHSSELYEEAKNGIAKMGIVVSDVKLDLKTMMAHKAESVDGLTKGVRFLFKKHKIDEIIGAATFTAKNKITVTLNAGGTEEYEAKSFVIATGSEPVGVPGVAIDEKLVVSSTGALALGQVPEHLLVVGAGYIGLEMGSVWRRLGSKVTVVEFLDRITPGMDAELAKTFQRTLQKQGLEFKLGMKVTAFKKNGKGADVTIEPAQGGAAETIIATSSSCPSAGVRTRKALASGKSASNSTTAAASSPTTTTAPMSPAFGPSATCAKGRCWRTKPKTKPSLAPRTSPARRAM